MKKKILFFIVCLLCCAESNSQSVSVRFAPNGKRDKFCSQMSLKEGFVPIELEDPGMVSVWFEYIDGAVVFMTRRGWTPNMELWFEGGKIENNWKSVYYINQINICYDTILVYAFELVGTRQSSVIIMLKKTKKKISILCWTHIFFYHQTNLIFVNERKINTLCL